MRFYFCFVLLFGIGLCYEPYSIVEYLHLHGGFSFLVQFIQDTGLNETLILTGPYTVFAPTDAAFNKLGVLGLQNLVNNPLTHRAVIQYHVLPEFVLVPMILHPIKKITLEGHELTLEGNGKTLLVNNASNVDFAPNNDIVVNNGVIQPIDTVLFPPLIPTLNIAQILVQDDARFKDLFLALILADLVTVLETGEFTVFAPVDAAFAVYKDNILDPSASNATAIYQEVLKYHIVPGARKANQLSDGQELFTLHGVPVSISVSPGGLMVNNANVIGENILATNGVIYATDALLIPSDIRQ